HIPLANVFIIDLYTWDNLIRIVKSGQATLLEILKLAKNNNIKPETTKLLFHMHLEDYHSDSDVELSFLSSEKESLNIRKASDWTELLWSLNRIDMHMKVVRPLPTLMPIINKKTLTHQASIF